MWLSSRKKLWNSAVTICHEFLPLVFGRRLVLEVEVVELFLLVSLIWTSSQSVGEGVPVEEAEALERCSREVSVVRFQQILWIPSRLDYSCQTALPRLCGHQISFEIPPKRSLPLK